MTDHAVVDTNVLVAANGRDTHVEIGCQLRCVEELARLTDQEVVCVDDKRLILNEYRRRSTSRGQKGRRVGGSGPRPSLSGRFARDYAHFGVSPPAMEPRLPLSEHSPTMPRLGAASPTAALQPSHARTNPTR